MALLTLLTCAQLYWAQPCRALPAAAQSSTAAARAARARAAAAARRGPVVGRAQMELGQKMARNAHEMASALPPPQRVALLTRLLYTMRGEVMATEKKQWAQELFSVAQQLPQQSAAEVEARNAALATASTRLAAYDADRALELLDGLPAEEGPHGVQPNARTMAARLVFAGYLQHHPGGSAVLMEHARRWGLLGSYPYVASAAILARLRGDEDASEQFFRQVLTIYARSDEGLYGTGEFAGLLQQAVSLEAILADTAEEAGRAIGVQLNRRVASGQGTLTEAQEAMVLSTLSDLRVSAPKAYEQIRLNSPVLSELRAPHVVTAPQAPIDVELETAFHGLGETIHLHKGPQATQEAVTSAIKLVNARYGRGACVECTAPDAQSVALVSLAAYALPTAIAAQLNAIQNPFWRGYFLAIAAQQVGQPTRVADPAARKLPEKEEPEPE